MKNKNFKHIIHFFLVIQLGGCGIESCIRTKELGKAAGPIAMAMRLRQEIRQRRAINGRIEQDPFEEQAEWVMAGRVRSGTSTQNGVPVNALEPEFVPPPPTVASNIVNSSIRNMYNLPENQPAWFIGIPGREITWNGFRTIITRMDRDMISYVLERCPSLNEFISEAIKYEQEQEIGNPARDARMNSLLSESVREFGALYPPADPTE